MKVNLKLNDLINKINFMDDVMTGQNGGCFMKVRTERGSLADFQKERVKQPTTQAYNPCPCFRFFYKRRGVGHSS